ncbi:MAG TPA: hypothetical protein VFR99_00620 [Marmoricola sp.]|jgi:hypothetical protein|nr:hypothetical protein [Marmoricola sp.]
MMRSLTLTQLADLLEDSADRATLQNFGEIRRMLRRRLAVEGIDHSPMWKATLLDFQEGCREMARELRWQAEVTT